jgi:3-deoxy-7-phosphoheptulonate synthase
VVVLLHSGADEAVARTVERWLTHAGASTRRVSDRGRVAIETAGAQAPLPPALRETLAALDGVEAVLEPRDAAPRVSSASPIVTLSSPVGPIDVGGEQLVFAFGPCAVDDEDHLHQAAVAAAASGARLLRGGAFKPRSSPYAFQGLGTAGLRLLRRVADAHGLAVVSEATSEASLDAVAAECELVQLGARSMSMAPLLRAAARTGRPLLLKRHFGATVDEWLLAAEYLLDAGATGVILCERGIRTFEPGTRATLDVGGLALARLRTPLPIIADPSHAAGTRALVEPLALAAVAAGAAGLIVECHADAGHARCDGPQALPLDALAPLVARARAVRQGVAICSPPWQETLPSSPLSSASRR